MIPNVRTLRTPTKVLIFAYTVLGILGLIIALELFFNFGIFMIELVFAYAAFYGTIGLVIATIVYFAVRKMKDIEEGGL
jgi:hypothetical protein